MLFVESPLGGSNPSTTANKKIMDILNVKEKDLSIIIPYKNGHTLLYNTFVHLFNHLNIEFEMKGDVTKILSNSYIFVRNPIDRFFSSYFFMEYVSRFGTEGHSDDVKRLVESTNIRDINTYIRNYNMFLSMCDDTHFIPQSSQILYNNQQIFLKNEIINDEIDMNLLYENKFGKNYKIFKIEDIDEVIKENTLNLISKNIGSDDRFNSIAFNTFKCEFEFLNDFSIDSNFLFTTFYFYFKNLHQTSKHHKNVNYIEKITLDEYRKVCEITKNEYLFFQYDEKVINRKLFKRNMI
jgi:hypothetical protein